MKLIKKAVILLTLITLAVLTCASLASCGDCLHAAYTDWVTIKEASCSETGIKERSCIECKEVFTSTISKKGHAYGDYRSDGNATCTYIGSLSATCASCGATKTKTDDGNPFGHTYFDGVCSDCGDELVLVNTYDASATAADKVSVKVYRAIDGHYELDVVGTGNMKDFAEGESAPWAAYKSDISVLHVYSGVVSLGDRAFFELDVLSEVNLEAGLKSVGRCAFPELFAPSITRVYDMATWVGLDFEDEGVPALYMTGLIYVGRVELDSNGKKTLTDKSTRIDNLVLDEGVESIGAYAFYQNNHITTVTLPSSLKSIGAYAFYDCGNIEEVYTPSLSSWCSIDFAERYANPLIYGRNLFVNNQLLSSLTLGEDVTTVTKGAFEGCTSIIDLKIKGGMTAIPDYAFYNCSGLRTLVLEEGIESIGSFAFYGASALTSVTLPASLTELGTDAFRNCKSLISLDIGDGLSSVSASAFRDCYHLMHLELGTGVSEIAADAFAGCVKIYEIENRSALDLVSHPIAENAIRIYTDNEQTKLTVIRQSDNASETVTGAGLVFYVDGDLTLLVGYIGERDKVTISSDIIGKSFSVYKNAFYNTHITALNVGEGIVRMYSGAFKDVSLTSVNLFDLAGWCGIIFDDHTANPLYLTSEVRLGDSTTKTLKLEIPDGITAINAYAFAGLGQITEFKIPESVKSIGRNAFMECISATKNANGVSYVGKWIVSLEKATTSATIATDTVGAVESAFDGCKVNSFSVNTKHLSLLPPELVASLSITGGTLTTDSFAPFTSLTTLSVNSSVALPAEEFTSLGITTLSVAKSALALFKSAPITSLSVVSGSLTRADIEPFAALETLTLEASVRSIERGTFKNLTALKSVAIRGGITSLPAEAFAGCTALSSVTLHSGLLSIEKSTFDGCNELIQNTNGVSYAAGWVVGIDNAAESVIISADTVGIARGVFTQDSSVKTVYYLERQASYNKIKFNSAENPAIVSAKVYYFLETKPNVTGDFWHYVDGTPTLWGE